MKPANKLKLFIPIVCVTLALLFACESPWMAEILQEKTITFNSNGGSFVPSQKLYAGERVTRPADPVWQGWIFEGWYEDNESFEKLYDFDFIPTHSMILYAKWRENEEEIEIEPGDPYIRSVEIKVTNPTKGAAPDKNAITSDTRYTCSLVTWSSDNGEAVSDVFQGNMRYTAKVTLTANHLYTFEGLTTATINTFTATVSDNYGSTVTLSYQFPATSEKIITGIRIKTDPTKMEYTHDQPLNLSGLTVTLIYNNDNTNTDDVGLGTYGIYAEPADNTQLIRTEHNNTKIKVILSSELFVSTNGSLTVNKANGADVGTVIILGNANMQMITVTTPLGTLGNGQSIEYAIGETDTAPTSGWQDTTFFNCSFDKSYYIFARSKGNDNYNAGAIQVINAPIAFCKVTFDEDLGGPVTISYIIRGDKLTYRTPSAANKPTPAGLYKGPPPLNCTFDYWYDEELNEWNFSNPVTKSMQLTASWSSGRVTTVDGDKINAAVSYVNTNTEGYTGNYTFFINEDLTISSNITFNNNKLKLVGAKPVTISITNPGKFNVQNTANLTIGKNITFAGTGAIEIGSTASVTLSDNAKINNLTLVNDVSSGYNSSVSIDSGWTGSVSNLNLSCENSSDNNIEWGVILYWFEAYILNGAFNAKTVANFNSVSFISSTSSQLITDPAHNLGIPNGFYICSDGTSDKGKLMSIPDEAYMEGSGAGSLAEFLNTPTGSLGNPTEIKILWNITAAAGYNIPYNTHIKLIVEEGKNRTITAGEGNFPLFKVNANASLTIEAREGGTITLNGNNEDAKTDRHGVDVRGNFTMGSGVIITGFKNSSSAVSNCGAGVIVQGQGIFNMKGGEIMNNTAVAGGGGGVNIYGATFNMDSGIIRNNTATSGGGGGVYMISDSTKRPIFNMKGGEIKNNTARSSGGGVCVSDGTFTMSGGHIYGADDTENKNTEVTLFTAAAIFVADKTTATAQYDGDYGNDAINTSNNTIPPAP